PDRHHRSRSAFRARAGQSRGIRDRPVLRRLYGRTWLRRPDGRLRLHDGDLCHHQDQLHLRDSVAPAGDPARRRRRPPQASHLERPLSAAGARGDRHALPDHRAAGGDSADLTLLPPHAHVRAPDGGLADARPAPRRTPMNYVECFRALARRRTDEIVVTSAGNSGQAWWAVTRDSEATFYLDASMSLATMFASGLA